MSNDPIEHEVYSSFKEKIFIGQSIDEAIAEISRVSGHESLLLRSAFTERFGDLPKFSFETFNNATKPDNAQN